MHGKFITLLLHYNTLAKYDVADVGDQTCIALFVYLCQFQKIDVTHKLVLELVPKTTEYLQPNPGRVSFSVSYSNVNRQYPPQSEITQFVQPFNTTFIFLISSL